MLNTSKFHINLHRPWPLWTLLAHCLLVIGSCEDSSAESFLDTRSDYQELRSLAATESAFDFNKEKPTETSLLVLGAIPPSLRSSFYNYVTEGGHVALLGSGDSSNHHDALLKKLSYQVVSSHKPHIIEGRPDLELVFLKNAHLLSEGVSSMVVPSTTRISNKRLMPLAYDHPNERSGSIFVASLGRGELVTFSDAAVFRDDLLRLPSQYRLLKNLLSYLSQNSREVFLIDRSSVVVPETSAAQISASLKKLGTPESKSRIAELSQSTVFSASVAGLVLVISFLFVGFARRKTQNELSTEDYSRYLEFAQRLDMIKARIDRFGIDIRHHPELSKLLITLESQVDIFHPHRVNEDRFEELSEKVAHLSRVAIQRRKSLQ